MHGTNMRKKNAYYVRSNRCFVVLDFIYLAVMLSFYSYKCLAIFQQLHDIDSSITADDIESAIVLSF